MEDVRTLPVLWFDEVWNKHREGAIDEMFHADGVAHGLGVPINGPADFKMFYRKFVRAFPDIRIEARQVVGEGDWTAVRFAATGTHTGPFEEIAATGNAIEVGGMAFARWRDGKIVEAYNSVDMLTLMKQIGAV